MAAFTRPPAPACGSFAALGPQLQSLAEAADSDMQTLSTQEIFRALDPPFLSLVKTATDNIDDSLFYQPVSFDTGFATVEATNNGGIIQGTLVSGDNPPAMILPNTPQQFWYYIGLYIQSPVNLEGTQWKLRLRVTNLDPVTGVTTHTSFIRGYSAPLVPATGNEYLWADFFVPSNGGRITPEAAMFGSPLVQVNAGRIWAIQISPRR